VFTRRSVLGGAVGAATATAGCLEGELDEVQESLLGADDRGEIVGTYDEGIERLNDANEARDDGIIAFNEERYGDSLDSLEQSLEHYADASGSFRSAESMAEEAGVPPAEKLCREAAVHAEMMHESTEAALEASIAAEEGESADVINDYIETAEQRQVDAEESPVAEADDLLDLLEAQ